MTCVLRKVVTDGLNSDEAAKYESVEMVWYVELLSERGCLPSSQDVSRFPSRSDPSLPTSR